MGVSEVQSHANNLFHYTPKGKPALIILHQLLNYLASESKEYKLTVGLSKTDHLINMTGEGQVHAQLCKHARNKGRNKLYRQFNESS